MFWPQAPPGRVASGEKIGVISFGTQLQQQQQQEQQQYRSVWIHITLFTSMFHLFLVQIPNRTTFFKCASKVKCIYKIFGALPGQFKQG
jgi:intracellular septation protein A